ncbi:hypothetical protein [Mesonia aquimarina]|uniref:hypothetical protein n=1 Tax=Mesonia aquimarina TaxID=1504967 RepID=UPI000EF56B7B|nr:hypothetical protein [Mesonia aquimarina]
MQPENFHKLLQESALISTSETEQLKNLIEEFPYFQSARALRLKGLKQNHSFSYNTALKKTAAYTTDRAVLFDLITSKEFKQDQISAQIKHRIIAEQEEDSTEKSKTNDLQMNLEEANKVLDPSLFTPSKKTSEEKSVETAEQKLAIGKPLEFDASESHSFSEWLKLTKTKPIERKANEKETEKNTEESAESSRKFQLIEEFIAKNPKIKPDKNSSISQQPLSQDSPSKQLMTETLARVYLEQKNYSKAIQAFKILILKNPEKSGLFADQIRSIEKLQENKNI